MRQQLLNFMKALEMAIPPPPNCHHALMWSQYGSEEKGWEDKLALQINNNGVFQCFFIEEGDLENPGFTIEVIAKMNAEAITEYTQKGVALGQHLKVIRIIDEKHHIENDQIVKTSTGEIVPEDEPLFLFRARDYLALPVLSFYLKVCKEDKCTKFQMEGIEKRQKLFMEFVLTHKDRMKQPGITEGLNENT